MTRTTRLFLLLFCPALLLGGAAAIANYGPGGTQTPPKRATRKPPAAGPQVSRESKVCLGCHRAVTPGIVKDWQASKHYTNSIDCFTCHNAKDKGDRPDAVEHHGFKIVVLVTPKNCQICHEREATEFQASRHADAAKFIGSLDNALGEIIGGGPAANSGCKQCHGSTIAVKDGQIDATTWPNTGIGRINPDGSKGACSACHSRHEFSIAHARTPEACGKCHLGPDHPQEEIWQESKHGTRYQQTLAQGKPTGIGAPAGKWIPGVSYSSGPTCASCHVSATPNQPTSHDVGARISWTLRPVVSTKLENWEKKRGSMQDVCMQCHAKAYVSSFYTQFDSLVTLYNTKFAQPAKTIMDKLTVSGKLTAQPFDAPIKWTYYELWHHEGRRARHGASMSGPDYAWWHGMYDVAKTFYTEFVPQARALDPQIVDETLKAMPEHDWFTKGMTREQVQQILDFYKTRYGQ